MTKPKTQAGRAPSTPTGLHLYQHGRPQGGFLEAILAIEAEAVKPWREALEQYAEHLTPCTYYGALSPGQTVPNPCSCGLDALLDESAG